MRRCEEISGTVRLSARELDGPYRVLRLTAVVENTSDWTPPEGRGADREAALPHSLVATHLLMALSAGSFLSMTDPPEWAKGAVAACRNLHTWPVLAGEPGRADLVLSSPIILEDHPAIAPESPGALYDATEIDEILALRTAALTDEEKREARGTDERAAAVIELADSMPPEVLERLHGAVRAPARGRPVPAPAAPGRRLPRRVRACTRPDTPWWDPAATRASTRRGPRGRGRPSVGRAAGSSCVRAPRRTDAQDIFLRGRTAKVEAVLHDVDGGVHLAVTVEGDPGADIRREQGRFLYFQPDEVTPLEDAREPPTGRPQDAGGGHRQRLPRRRRLRRGDRAAGSPSATCPDTSRSWTSGCAGCTSPTSCWTATTPSSWWTPRHAAKPPARCT